VPQLQITLKFEWSPWINWKSLVPFQRHPARGPLPSHAGVYEIRQSDAVDPDQLLLIGSSPRLTNLYKDVLETPESQQTRRTRLGDALAAKVQGDLSRLEIRWATIEAPYRIALEWTLIQHYAQRFGQPPPLAARL
jgi:hypothetical protein